MNTKLRLALILGMLFVVCVSLTSAEDAQSEPEPGAEPEGEPEGTAKDEDTKAAGNTVGKTGESKAGPNNPAAAPMASAIVLAMALVAKYIL